MKITGWLDTGQQVQVLPMEPILGSQERGDEVLHSEGPLQAVPSAMTLRMLGLCGLHDETQTALLSTSTSLGTLTGYFPRTRLPSPQGQPPHPVPKDTCKKDYSVTFGGRQ